MYPSYNRFRNLYSPGQTHPFKLSRSKLDLFLECPRCFYLDRRLGISRPSMPGFSLNSAVDTLLKKEFDILREKSHAHDLFKSFGIDAVPFKHPDMDTWRENFKGKEALDPDSNILVTGAIDDIWVTKEGFLHIVDYKSTSTVKEISLEDQWKQGYKLQMEIYQWIFRMGGFNVSEIGYFLFANASKERPSFNKRLEFELSIISYKGNDDWIKPSLIKVKELLEKKEAPDGSKNCEYCAFVSASSKSVSRMGQLTFEV